MFSSKASLLETLSWHHSDQLLVRISPLPFTSFDLMSLFAFDKWSSVTDVTLMMPNPTSFSLPKIFPRNMHVPFHFSELPERMVLYRSYIHDKPSIFLIYNIRFQILLCSSPFLVLSVVLGSCSSQVHIIVSVAFGQPCVCVIFE